MFGLHVRLDELRCDLRDDSVPQSTQLSHSPGYPMSQATNSGFNTPRFSVSAGDEVEVEPEGSWRGMPCFDLAVVLSASATVGESHPDN